MNAPKPGELASVPNAPQREGKVRLTLYLASSTPSSRRAAINLDAALLIFVDRLDFSLERVDVLVDTRRAAADSVIMTPTLVVVGRNSRSIIIGDLSDTRRLHEFLMTAAGLY